MSTRNVMVIVPELQAMTKRRVIEELVAAAAVSPSVTNAKALRAAVLRRERLEGTALGSGVAVPHAISSAVSGLVLVLGRSARGIPFGASDHRSVHLVFLLAVPSRQVNHYLRALGAITRLMTRKTMRDRLLKLSSPSAIRRFLRQHLA